LSGGRCANALSGPTASAVTTSIGEARPVLYGLCGEDTASPSCARERIVQNLYYRWSEEFLEAGKKRLAGDTARAATSERQREPSALKEAVAELTVENRLQKKARLGRGRTTHEILRH
jgi:transposase